MSHSDWVQSLVESKNPKDRSFAKEMLGKTRYDLVAGGKLKVERLYFAGKIRTIKELKELYK